MTPEVVPDSNVERKDDDNRINETILEISAAEKLVESFRTTMENNFEIMMVAVDKASQVLTKAKEIMQCSGNDDSKGKPSCLEEVKEILNEFEKHKLSTNSLLLSDSAAVHDYNLDERLSKIEQVQQQQCCMLKDLLELKNVLKRDAKFQGETKTESTSDETSSIADISMANDGGACEDNSANAENSQIKDEVISSTDSNSSQNVVTLNSDQVNEPDQRATDANVDENNSTSEKKDTEPENHAKEYSHPYNLIRQSKNVYPYDHKCPIIFDVIAHVAKKEGGSAIHKSVRAIYIPNVKETCVPTGYDTDAARKKPGTSFSYSLPWWRKNFKKRCTTRGKLRFELVLPSDKRVVKSPVHEMDAWVCDSATYNNSITLGQDFAANIHYIDHETQKVTLRYPNCDQLFELPFRYLIVARKVLFDYWAVGKTSANMFDDKWIRLHEKERSSGKGNGDEQQQQKGKKESSSSNGGKTRKRTNYDEKTSPLTSSAKIRLVSKLPSLLDRSLCRDRRSGDRKSTSTRTTATPASSFSGKLVNPWEEPKSWPPNNASRSPPWRGEYSQRFTTGSTASVEPSRNKHSVCEFERNDYSKRFSRPSAYDRHAVSVETVRETSKISDFVTSNIDSDYYYDRCNSYDRPSTPPFRSRDNHDFKSCFRDYDRSPMFM